MSVSKRIANLPPDKLKLLLERLQQREGAPPKGDRIPKQPRDGRTFPLTHAQESLWFHGELDPDNPAYHIPISVGLRGELNAPALERSLNEVVRRHEVLRTVFPRVDDKPVQRIQPAAHFQLSWADLSDLPDEYWEAEASRLAMRAFKHPFPIAEGPLYRFLLIHLRKEDFRLIMIMHHLIIDNWCQALINREIYTLYAAFAQGRPSPFPELAIQYADYAVWQREMLGGEKLERLLAFWKKRLAGAPSLEMPLDRSRPRVFHFSGARASLTLSPNLSRGLRELSKRRNVTLFTAMLAVFQCLVSRYSGQEDLSFGTPIVHRDRVEIEELIGYFVNALVLRTDLSGNPDFSEALTRVKQTCLDAYAHQELPFELLVKALNPPRDLSRNPLFQIMFYNQANPRLSDASVNKNDAPASGPRGTGFQKYDFDVTRFDLEVEILDEGKEIQCNVMYSTGLFESGTADRLLRHFRELLIAVVADDSQKIAHLPLMPAEERRQLLQDWSGKTPAYPRDRPIHGLFEDVAAAMPHAVAMVQEDVYHCYDQLNRDANRLAHSLREQGLIADQPVGLFVDRGPERAIAVLAILKAGGAYFPLSAKLPEPRLAFLLADAGADLVIASGDLAAQFPDAGARVVDLAALRPSLRNFPDSNPSWPTAPEQSAYLMYTSGSTGNPKGIAIPHRAVTRLVMDNCYARFGPDQVLIHIAPISFDASTFELWGCWLHGGKLVLPLPGIQGMEELSQAFQRYRVTLLWLTTGLFNMMVEHHPQGFAGLRAVLTGGEALSPDHVRRFQEAHPNCRLVNMYGPTETTTFATYHPVSEASFLRESIPIGKPIHHSRVYLLDRRLEAAPTGVNGELHIGGDGLARGYHRRPAATAQQFIPNPMSSLPGDRLYKTGDLVRWLPSGDIEFLGRKDWQVKLRGFRIEPGEIEEALQKHEKVSVAAVLTRATSAGDKQLVAYVKSGAADPIDTAHLHAFLKVDLPDYMIPSVFISLPEFPLNPNGKVDRAALAKLGKGEWERPAYTPPRNQREAVISGIWSEVLNLERIGVHDNFFELGGHSILATRIVSRLSQSLERAVPLRMLFEKPTIALLAAALDEAEEKGGRANAPMLTPRPPNIVPPLSFSQERLWFLHQMVPGNPFYNIPTAARLNGLLSLMELERSLAEVVSRHENLRTTFEVVEGHPIQTIHATFKPNLPVVDLSGLPDMERENLAADLIPREYGRIFDLGVPPLFRVLLLRTGECAHLWVLTLHHIIADGQSVQVLQAELDAIYQAFLQEEGSPLAQLPIQYADYAWWQRQWLSGPFLDEMLSFWKQQLQGVPTTLLPLDRARPEIASFKGGGLQSALPGDLTTRLRDLARREGLTLFMVLTAAFKAMLHHYHGQEDLVVGTPVANRDHPELEGLVGFFLNMLPLRTRLDGNPPFLELARRVRRVCLDAFSHQDLAFEKLVDMLKPGRDYSAHPIFQIAFQIETRSDPGPESSPDRGLQLGALDFDPGTTRYDLEVHIRETANQLRVGWVYSGDLFQRETIERMARCYRTLLARVAAHPEIRLDELRLLSGTDAKEATKPASRLVGAFDLPGEYQGERARYWVLGPYGRPAPPGIAGEIAVEYPPNAVHAAALSAPTSQNCRPFDGARPGARIFRTGAIGRAREDGVHYLGQGDDLMMLRGVPTSLKQLERRLNGLPGVDTCALVRMPGQSGREPICAFVVPTEEKSAKPEAFLHTLGEQYPGQAPPDRLVILDSLPRDEQGRVDREKLRERQELRTSGSAPESDMERTLIALWREALDVEEVSVHDNFFEMGGSSLQIIRLQKQLGNQLNRHIPVIHIFQNPTIRSLARFLTHQSDESQAVQKARDRVQRQRMAINRQRKKHQARLGVRS